MDTVREVIQDHIAATRWFIDICQRLLRIETRNIALETLRSIQNRPATVSAASAN